MDQNDTVAGPFLFSEPTYLDGEEILWQLDPETGVVSLGTLEKRFLDVDCSGDAWVYMSDLFDPDFISEETIVNVAFQTADDSVIHVPIDTAAQITTRTAQSKRDSDGNCQVEALEAPLFPISDTMTVAAQPTITFEVPFRLEWVGPLPD